MYDPATPRGAVRSPSVEEESVAVVVVASDGAGSGSKKQKKKKKKKAGKKTKSKEPPEAPEGAMASPEGEEDDAGHGLAWTEAE